MAVTQARLTEAQFLRRPDNGRKYEWVDGEPKEAPTSFDHDAIGAIIVYRLTPSAIGRGYITLSQAGFRMADGNLRCPDVGYTRKERLPGGRPLKGFPDFAPDLAVEIISDSEERADMARKVAEYFASGAQQVWHVFPDTRQIVVFASPGESRVWEEEDILDGGALLPGFRSRVGDLFALE